MRVALIRPRPDDESIGLMNLMVCEPLELEYLAAHLDGLGHQVSVIDMILERGRLEDIVSQDKPDLIGMTAYITHVGVIRKYAQRLKSFMPRTPIIVGGVHAEVCPGNFEDPSIDYIAHVNGMETIGQLASRLASCQDAHENIEAIPGLWAGLGAKPYELSTEPLRICPDRGSTARYRRHYSYLFHVPCALMKTSYGCPYVCDFCFCRQVTRGQYFERPIEDAVSELETIEEANVFIVDDNFLLNARRVSRFCDLLEERNIQKKYILFGRTDFIAANSDLIGRFAKLGLTAVFIGVESHRDEDLKVFAKRCSVQTHEEAALVLHRHGVDAYTGVVVGENWTGEDFRSLGDWLLRHHMALVNIQPLTPLPGTPSFDRHRDSLVIARDDYAKWDLTHLAVRPSRMTPRSFYRHLIGTYFRTASHPRVFFSVLRRYGLGVAIRMLRGGFLITAQYLRLWARAEA